MNQRFDTFVFDLDGTLLDTLPDLVELTNQALREAGLPERTHDEILSFVGNGVKALMYQAVPEGTDQQTAEHVMQRWKKLYPDFGSALTVPYPNMVDVVIELKRRGVKIAVLSNKFDAGVKQIIPEHFGDLFEIMYGECEAIPRKPDPTGLLKTIEELGSEPARTAYVGDSAGDMTVSHNAGVFALGVSWGYQTVEQLREAGADAIIDNPEELLAFAIEG